MRRSPFLPCALVAALAVPAGGCAARRMDSRSESSPRPAADVPDHFLVSTPTGTEEPQPGEGCRNPLVDPRDGTTLVLVRSSGGRGDYEPRPVRYGLREGELLRVECASGRAVGIVR